jgi:hypothetical protein
MILAIDPGPTESAYLKMRDGKIIDFAKVENLLLLDLINADKGFISHIVCEEIRCFMMRVGSPVFDTARWSGRYEQLSHQYSIPFYFVGWKEVSYYWCGSRQAKDPDLRAALISFYGQPGIKKSPGPTYNIKNYDVWSALAIAGYWHAKQNGQV